MGKLLKDILDQMNFDAEKTTILTYQEFKDYDLPLPLTFKPGVGDKFIFKLIAEEAIKICKFREDAPEARYLFANRVMIYCYYPDYSEFDRQQLEEAK